MGSAVVQRHARRLCGSRDRSLRSAIAPAPANPRRLAGPPKPSPRRPPARSAAVPCARHPRAALPAARSSRIAAMLAAPETRRIQSRSGRISGRRRSAPGNRSAGDWAMGSEAGTSLASNGTADAATSTPSAPPSSASTRLSVINWRTRRSRPAPMAVLTASSLWRANPRASSRFARFAQAISSTQTAAPLSASSSRRDLLRQLVAQQVEGGSGMLVLLGKLPLELGRHDAHLRAGLFQRNTRSSAALRLPDNYCCGPGNRRRAHGTASASIIRRRGWGSGNRAA